MSAFFGRSPYHAKTSATTRTGRMNSRLRCSVCKNYFPADEALMAYRQKCCSEQCLGELQDKTRQRKREWARKQPKRPIKRTYAEGLCELCGRTFWRRKDQIGRHPHTYCSARCADEVNGRNARGRELPTRRTGATINCDVCGTGFYVSASRLANGARFCSKACLNVWNADQPRLNFISSANNAGKRNGRYTHGRRVGTNDNKRAVRAAVIDRDGDWCLVCGQPPKGLHLHRIRFGSQGGQYLPENCVQLCGLHHDALHRGPKLPWQDLLREYVARTMADDGHHGDWFRGEVAGGGLLPDPADIRPRRTA